LGNEAGDLGDHDGAEGCAAVGEAALAPRPTRGPGRHGPRRRERGEVGGPVASEVAILGGGAIERGALDRWEEVSEAVGRDGFAET
jgi:hypothetical protein